MRLVIGMVLAALVTVGFTGCGAKSEPVVSQQPADAHAGHEHAGEEQAADAHGGWWCIEHGVPEGECALCDTSLIAGFKSQGDWCDEHQRPETHCFVCNPENLNKFAARYEAKFGEKPPQPTE